MHTPAWIDRLERHFGGWAIPHLLRGLVVLNALTFLLDLSSRGFVDKLLLEHAPLVAGEYWRLVTFLFAKAGGTGAFTLLFFFFWMMFLWMVGDVLEQAWGSFKVTLYLLLPAFLLGILVFTGLSPFAPNAHLFTSLFFAFATLHPDHEIILFPIPIPLKVKWVAWVGVGLVALGLVFDPASFPIILASFSSYFLFFLPGWVAARRHRAETAARRKRFQHDDE